MSQERIFTHQSEPDVEPDAPLPPTATVASAAALDSVLDEIDDVLQHNAESFVRSFVQKGGQ